MSQHSPEDLVRRATAAFNAGSRDEARKLCEQGLSRAPGDPMLSHLLAAVLFSQGEIEPARGHVETSLAERPGNAAAQLLAARIARAATHNEVADLPMVAVHPLRCRRPGEERIQQRPPFADVHTDDV